MAIFYYLIWHYSRGLVGLTGAWFNYLHFILHFFSVGPLFTSLFSPWHRDTSFKRTPGFDLREFMERLGFNLLSRLLGAIIRSGVILVGIAVEIFVIVLGIIFLLFWFIYPLIILGGIILALNLLLK